MPRRVAKCRRSQSCTVFFDEYEQASLWGRNLNDHLADVYEHKARYCLMLVSKEYADKVWTTLERRSAQARALKQKEEYILPVHFDKTEVPCLPHSIGHIEAIGLRPNGLAPSFSPNCGGNQRSRPFGGHCGGVRRDLRRMRFFVLGFSILIGVFLYTGLPQWPLGLASSPPSVAPAPQQNPSPFTISFDVWKDLGRDHACRRRLRQQ